jgi:hypothetical protein
VIKDTAAFQAKLVEKPGTGKAALREIDVGDG